MSKKYSHDFNDIAEIGRYDLPWGNVLVFTKYNHVLGGGHRHSTGWMGGHKYKEGGTKIPAETLVKYTEFDPEGDVMAGCNGMDPDLFKNSEAKQMMEKLTRNHIEKSMHSDPETIVYNKNLLEYRSKKSK